MWYFGVEGLWVGLVLEIPDMAKKIRGVPVPGIGIRGRSGEQGK